MGVSPNILRISAFCITLIQRQDNVRTTLWSPNVVLKLPRFFPSSYRRVKKDCNVKTNIFIGSIELFLHCISFSGKMPILKHIDQLGQSVLVFCFEIKQILDPKAFMAVNWLLVFWLCKRKQTPYFQFPIHDVIFRCLALCQLTLKKSRTFGN